LKFGSLGNAWGNAVFQAPFYMERKGEMKNYTILEVFAGKAVGVRFEEMDGQTVTKLKLCLMDALECCMAANPVDSRIVGAFESIRQYRSGGPCLLFGTGLRANAAEAAFYNGVTGSVSSRNDISKEGSCHPGAVVVPVALAMGEERRTGGREVLESMAVGYETMIRLGRALKKAGIERALRMTALVAPFGAAFAAAKAMGLPGDQTMWAAGFACNRAFGLNNWAVEGTGEDVFQNAWGAETGISAARLASVGTRASARALEGKDGLLQAFGAEEAAGYILEELGERLFLQDVEFKPMDSCFKLQAPCQAAARITHMPEFRRDEVERVVIRVSRHARYHAGSDNREIVSAVQAIMSIPFGVSYVLVNGDYRKICWDPPCQDQVRALMDRCELVEDERYTALFPGKHGAMVTVWLRNGVKLEAEQEDVRSLTELETARRFLGTAAEFAGPENAERLYETIMELEKVENIQEMTELMRWRM